jgi:uncharacterized cupredoxin-like copper-binding protein
MMLAWGGRLTVAAAIAGLTLVGCGAGTESGRSGGSVPANNAPGPGMMMGGGSTMMGGASGYAFSKLTCTAPADLPGPVVRVTLGDMGMTQMMGGTAPLGEHRMLRAQPSTVAAGRVSLVAANMGWRTHELVILPLTAGDSAGQRVPGPDGTVDETGSLGEASTSCGAGAGDGIQAGTVSWTTLTLAAGRYELVCNLPNHYADGMYQEFVVTPP